MEERFSNYNWSRSDAIIAARLEWSSFYETKWNKKAGMEGGNVCPNHHLKIFSCVEIIVFYDDVDELSFGHFGRINF